MDDSDHLSMLIPESMAGRRLDQALAALFPDYSRSRLQQWIREGRVSVDERQMRPRDLVKGGERVELTPVIESEQVFEAEAIPLDVVHEDEALIVVNKPPGMVVHPATGNWSGTLVNALLHHAPELAAVPRAGVIHRLDKDTSGLLVVSRSLSAHKYLVEQLQARKFEREYEAITTGVMTAGGTVKAPVGRHPSQRTRMAVVSGGKVAVTHYTVVERYRAHTRIRVRLETGRTHQIRVHMAHIQYPIVGDPTYGGRMRIPPDSTDTLMTTLQSFKRQALHATRLGIIHPVTRTPMHWQAPLPDDMQALINALEQDKKAHE